MFAYYILFTILISQFMLFENEQNTVTFNYPFKQQLKSFIDVKSKDTLKMKISGLRRKNHHKDKAICFVLKEWSHFDPIHKRRIYNLSAIFQCCGTGDNRPKLNYISLDSSNYKLLKNYEISHTHEKISPAKDDNHQFLSTIEKQNSDKKLQINEFQKDEIIILDSNDSAQDSAQDADFDEFRSNNEIKGNQNDRNQFSLSEMLQNYQFQQNYKNPSLSLQNQKQSNNQIISFNKQNKFKESSETQKQIQNSSPIILERKHKQSTIILESKHKQNLFDYSLVKQQNRLQQQINDSEQAQQQFDFPLETQINQLKNLNYKNSINGMFCSLLKKEHHKGKLIRYKIKTGVSSQFGSKINHAVVHFQCCSKNMKDPPTFHYISQEGSGSYRLLKNYRIHHHHIKNQHTEQVKGNNRRSIKQNCNKNEIQKQVLENQRGKVIKKRGPKRKNGLIHFEFPLKKDLKYISFVDSKQTLRGTLYSLRIKSQNSDKDLRFQTRKTVFDKAQQLYRFIVYFRCCSISINKPFLYYQSKDGQNFTLQKRYNIDHFHKPKQQSRRKRRIINSNQNEKKDNPIPEQIIQKQQYSQFNICCSQQMDFIEKKQTSINQQTTKKGCIEIKRKRRTRKQMQAVRQLKKLLDIQKQLIGKKRGRKPRLKDTAQSCVISKKQNQYKQEFQEEKNECKQDQLQLMKKRRAGLFKTKKIFKQNSKIVENIDSDDQQEDALNSYFFRPNAQQSKEQIIQKKNIKRTNQINQINLNQEDSFDTKMQRYQNSIKIKQLTKENNQLRPFLKKLRSKKQKTIEIIEIQNDQLNIQRNDKESLKQNQQQKFQPYLGDSKNQKSKQRQIQQQDYKQKQQYKLIQQEKYRSQSNLQQRQQQKQRQYNQKQKQLQEQRQYIQKQKQKQRQKQIQKQDFSIDFQHVENEAVQKFCLEQSKQSSRNINGNDNCIKNINQESKCLEQQDKIKLNKLCVIRQNNENIEENIREQQKQSESQSYFNLNGSKNNQKSQQQLNNNMMEAQFKEKLIKKNGHQALDHNKYKLIDKQIAERSQQKLRDKYIAEQNNQKSNKIAEQKPVVKQNKFIHQDDLFIRRTSIVIQQQNKNSSFNKNCINGNSKDVNLEQISFQIFSDDQKSQQKQLSLNQNESKNSQIPKRMSTRKNCNQGEKFMILQRQRSYAYHGNKSHLVQKQKDKSLWKEYQKQVNALKIYRGGNYFNQAVQQKPTQIQQISNIELPKVKQGSILNINTNHITQIDNRRRRHDAIREQLRKKAIGLIKNKKGNIKFNMIGTKKLLSQRQALSKQKSRTYFSLHKYQQEIYKIFEQYRQRKHQTNAWNNLDNIGFQQMRKKLTIEISEQKNYHNQDFFNASTALWNNCTQEILQNNGFQKITLDKHYNCQENILYFKNCLFIKQDLKWEQNKLIQRQKQPFKQVIYLTVLPILMKQLPTSNHLMFAYSLHELTLQPKLLWFSFTDHLIQKDKEIKNFKTLLLKQKQIDSLAKVIDQTLKYMNLINVKFIATQCNPQLMKCLDQIKIKYLKFKNVSIEYGMHIDAMSCFNDQNFNFSDSQYFKKISQKLRQMNNLDQIQEHLDQLKSCFKETKNQKSLNDQFKELNKEKSSNKLGHQEFNQSSRQFRQKQNQFRQKQNQFRSNKQNQFRSNKLNRLNRLNLQKQMSNNNNQNSNHQTSNHQEEFSRLQKINSSRDQIKINKQLNYPNEINEKHKDNLQDKDNLQYKNSLINKLKRASQLNSLNHSYIYYYQQNNQIQHENGRTHDKINSFDQKLSQQNPRKLLQKYNRFGQFISLYNYSKSVKEYKSLGLSFLPKQFYHPNQQINSIILINQIVSLSSIIKKYSEIVIFLLALFKFSSLFQSSPLLKSSSQLKSSSLSQSALRFNLSGPIQQKVTTSQQIVSHNHYWIQSQIFQKLALLTNLIGHKQIQLFEKLFFNQKYHFFSIITCCPRQIIQIIYRLIYFAFNQQTVASQFPYAHQNAFHKDFKQNQDKEQYQLCQLSQLINGKILVQNKQLQQKYEVKLKLQPSNRNNHRNNNQKNNQRYPSNQRRRQRKHKEVQSSQEDFPEQEDESDQQQKKWFCSCNFYEIAGIPCEHQIYLALIYQTSLFNEISNQWKCTNSNLKDKSPLNQATNYQHSCLKQEIQLEESSLLSSHQGEDLNLSQDQMEK